MESHGFQIALKRGMDIRGSLVGLILFSPLMLVTAIAIKITSPGPIIFKQSRLGMKGARFPFYKFRSMHWNVDDRIHREYVTNLIKGEPEKINQGAEETPLFKMKSDPRVTRFGKIIRKTSIDELPQFFNVLKGEMSLVGPRPPLTYEVEKYEPWHLRRILDVKPGITGLWQVSGRSTISFNEMIRLDLRYAQNWSLWLDLKILLKTVRALIPSRSAW
jgi:exopolysaccharide biosynthesis polyprenyl glycosylphosphotransferase